MSSVARGSRAEWVPMLGGRCWWTRCIPWDILDFFDIDLFSTQKRTTCHPPQTVVTAKGNSRWYKIYRKKQREKNITDMVKKRKWRKKVVVRRDSPSKVEKLFGYFKCKKRCLLKKENAWSWKVKVAWETPVESVSKSATVPWSWRQCANIDAKLNVLITCDGKENESKLYQEFKVGIRKHSAFVS